MIRNSGGAALIAVCLLIGCIVNLPCSNVRSAYGSEGGLVVDTFTDKAPFDGRGINQSSDAFSPIEPVVLYSLVTYNGAPIVGFLVAYQISGPAPSLQQVRTAVTNQSGVATVEFGIPWGQNVTASFGTWKVFSSVAIGQISAFDILTFQVGWLITTSIETVSPTQYPERLVPEQSFVTGSEVGVEVNLTSIAMSVKNVILAIAVCDSLNRTINEEKNQYQMPPGQLSTYRVFTIPKWATTGNATIFADVYTNESSNVNTPYSPENSATFNIGLMDDAIFKALVRPTELYVGQTVGTNVTVKNLGSIFTTFNVTVYANGVPIQTLTVTSLEPGEERTLSFSWNTSGVKVGVFTITASASVMPGETNTANNYYTIGQVTILEHTAPINARSLYLILLIIFLLFLLALLALLVLRRRKKDESEIMENLSYFL